jgi:hypothetical protein
VFGGLFGFFDASEDVVAGGVVFAEAAFADFGAFALAGAGVVDVAEDLEGGGGGEAGYEGA